MLHLYVDADACPVKDEVYRVADRYGLPVTLVANSYMRYPTGGKVTLVVVEKGLDEADDRIVALAGPDDIVITADIPLAARCLDEGARVLGHTGRPFTKDNVGEALASRQLLKQLRDQGVMGGGPPPFGKKERSQFLQQLDQMIQAIKRG
ncbi:MAG TPA: YaiI/YqxD family protein [Candidatus Krumholzibacteria bacterium]|nr:YaiI/YqxD family protein [Candidatus Krumholzibacteria bacterium]HRX52314.1 YaiI/YqxD family protein [Candidatus Krumholzibacteria bacterium]